MNTAESRAIAAKQENQPSEEELRVEELSLQELHSDVTALRKHLLDYRLERFYYNRLCHDIGGPIIYILNKLDALCSAVSATKVNNISTSSKELIKLRKILLETKTVLDKVIGNAKIQTKPLALAGITEVESVKVVFLSEERDRAIASYQNAISQSHSIPLWDSISSAGSAWMQTLGLYSGNKTFSWSEVSSQANNLAKALKGVCDQPIKSIQHDQSSDEERNRNLKSFF